MPWPKGVAHRPEMKARRLATFIANGKRRKAPRVEDGVTLWRCPTCGTWKTAEGFYSSARTSNGLSSQCRECHTEGSVRTRDPENARASNRLHEANRRARLANAPGVLTASVLAQLADILGRTCLACGCDSDVQWDHIVPIARGGENRPGNLQPLCRRCNEIKQARTADYRTDEQRARVAAVWVLSFRRVES